MQSRYKYDQGIPILQRGLLGHEVPILVLFGAVSSNKQKNIVEYYHVLNVEYYHVPNIYYILGIVPGTIHTLFLSLMIKVTLQGKMRQIVKTD